MSAKKATNGPRLQQFGFDEKLSLPAIKVQIFIDFILIHCLSNVCRTRVTVVHVYLIESLPFQDPPLHSWTDPGHRSSLFFSMFVQFYLQLLLVYFGSNQLLKEEMNMFCLFCSCRWDSFEALIDLIPFSVPEVNCYNYIYFQQVLQFWEEYLQFQCFPHLFDWF